VIACLQQVLIMPPTTIRCAPALDTFTTLADHQSHTPTTFYNAKPVLHFHATSIRAITSRESSSKLPIFASETPSAAETEAEGTEALADCIQEIDAYISSEFVMPGFDLPEAMR